MIFNKITFKQYLQRYGYKFGLLRLTFCGSNLHYVKDYEIKKILYYKKIQDWIIKYINKYSSINPNFGFPITFDLMESPIWMFWDSSLEKAPEIVQICVYSVISKYKSRVILLNSSNYEDYIIFPDYIKEKCKRGKISIAAFTDLLRFSLLSKYGGFWIDATVLLTKEIPAYIESAPLFAFRHTFGEAENLTLLASWFIKASPNNAVIKEVRNILFGYWTEQNHICEYLLPYIVFASVAKKTTTGKNIPYESEEYSELLRKHLFDEFNSDQLNHFLELTSIHKLSYKFDQNVFLKPNTFYSYLKNKYVKNN